MKKIKKNWWIGLITGYPILLLAFTLLHPVFTDEAGGCGMGGGTASGTQASMAIMYPQTLPVAVNRGQVDSIPDFYSKLMNASYATSNGATNFNEEPTADNEKLQSPADVQSAGIGNYSTVGEDMQFYPSLCTDPSITDLDGYSAPTTCASNQDLCVVIMGPHAGSVNDTVYRFCTNNDPLSFDHCWQMPTGTPPPGEICPPPP